MILKTIHYRDHVIELTPNWWTCFMINHGTLKSDTLQGIKSKIRELSEK